MCTGRWVEEQLTELLLQAYYDVQQPVVTGVVGISNHIDYPHDSFPSDGPR